MTLRLSYNGITSAFQAEETGSTPAGRLKNSSVSYKELEASQFSCEAFL